MHHMAETLDDELFRHLDRANLGNAPDIVAPEIEQHQMLGPLLGIGEKFGLEPQILLPRRSPWSGSGERAERHLPVAQPDEDLRARSRHGEAAKIEEEKKWRGVDPPEGAIEGEGRQRERERKALAWH